MSARWRSARAGFQSTGMSGDLPPDELGEIKRPAGLDFCPGNVMRMQIFTPYWEVYALYPFTWVTNS